jgi:hypothetical protein
MPDSNPGEDPDLEGMPMDERPPGIDVELDAEGALLPRDYGIASGSDPAYPVTVAEQLAPESVAARAGREVPDLVVPDDRFFDEEQPEVPVGRRCPRQPRAGVRG